jgi:rubrerythrin
MIGEAVADDNIDARHSLEYAMSIEMEHSMLFKKAKSNPGNLQEASYHICPLCGHTAPGKAPKKCPYCGVDKKKFIEVK